MRKFCLALCIAVLSTSLAAAQGGPRVSITKLQALPTPLPYPYDKNADAGARVREALARAQQNGKRVLVDFGANWCPDCRILAGVLELPEVKSFVAEHYEVVTVDVGRFNRNIAVVQQFGIRQLAGLPTIVIADADGKPLIVSNATEIAGPRGATPQTIADWLARWAPKKTAS
jgi:thioredoxin-like negative regulator of GroEL